MIVPIDNCTIPAPAQTIDYARFTTSASIVSVLIAAIVCYIAYQQWRTARDKLRLDLYNRRFDVYLCALAYAQELLYEIKRPLHLNPGRMGSELFQSLTKSYYEAQFLFRPDSKISELLNEMMQRTSGVLDLARSVAKAENIVEAPIEFQIAVEQTTIWLNSTIDSLNERIAPYLNFHNLRSD